ncbi:efflux RND transporter periplasmic adaptor subunit [Bacillus massiliglaciei]|uniref:hypothetical protein n=1 Tax=Bacillus massiliglaciei TaxID=1816693 RepID=UPI000DA61E5D|nr:hypothetical protein [Bacillus massiliglaciei]
MKKWKVWTGLSLSAALVAVNLYLVEQKDSKVDRTVFVKKWERVKKGTVTESFQVKGVARPAGERYVYFDEKEGKFGSFLVKEGDQVSEGTPLYTYETPALDAERKELEREKSLTEGEIAEIERYISKLEGHTGSNSDGSSFPAEETAGAFHEGLDAEASVSPEPPDSSEDLMQQEIYKQEMEAGKLAEKVKSIDAELTAIEEKSQAGQAESETDGIIKDVNPSLKNPVITIAEGETLIEGILTVGQLKKAETGMAVQIISPYLKKPVSGTIEKIQAYPEKEPNLETEGTYAFEAAMDQTGSGEKTADQENSEPAVKEENETVHPPSEAEDNGLPAGAKADVTIITDEAKNVPFIRKDTVRHKDRPFVYTLNHQGKVSRENIQEGLAAKGRQELKEGPGAGTVILQEPKKIPMNDSKFITRVKTEKAGMSAFKQLTPKKRWRYFLIGLLEK